MSSTYSSNLRIELIGSGDQAGAWGATTDSNLAYILDTAIAGYQTVSVTAASQALTYVNGPSSTASLNQSVYAMLRFTTTTGAAFSVFAPPVPKAYIIYNNSGYTMSLKVSDVIGSTTPYAGNVALTISNGNKILVWSDGVSFYDVQAQNLTGTLAIVNGGTGQTTQQAAINALTGTQTNSRVLRSDGTNATLSQVVLTTDVTGTLPVANGGTGATGSTGSGNVVLATSPTISSPTFTTPALGTPASGTLTNCTFPTLNQNTSGTAAGLSATLAVASGGTGQTTAANAGSALGAIGVGQTTQDVTSSRARATTYTNSTGRPIMVYISFVNDAANSITSQLISLDSVTIINMGLGSDRRNACTFIVPNGSTYRVDIDSRDTIQSWFELRT